MLDRHPDTGVVLHGALHARRTAKEEPALTRDPLGVLAGVELLDERQIHARVVGGPVVVHQPLPDRRRGRVEIVDRGGIENAVGVRTVVRRAVTVLGEYPPCTSASG